MCQNNVSVLNINGEITQGSADSWHTAMEVPLIDNKPPQANGQRNSDNNAHIQSQIYPVDWDDKITLKTIWRNRNKDIMLKILVMCLYVADVFSDLFLAVEYLREQHYLNASLTLIFVWVPSMFVAYDSYRRKTKLKMNSWKNRLICIPLVLFSVEPVLCYIQSIIYAIKLNMAENHNLKREKEKYYEQMMDQSRDVVDLKLYEGCMEAVPQLILQFSIILRTYGDHKRDITLLLQVTSIVFSFGGLALTIITWIQAVAIAQHCRITIIGLFVWSTGRLATLVSRVLSVTGSASVSPGYTAIGMGIHWFGASFWHYYMYQSVYQNVIVSAAVGILNTFLSRVDNLLHANISHTILVVEDVIMIIIWVICLEQKIRSSSCYIPFLCLNIASCVMGTVFSTIYIVYQKYFMIGENPNIKIIKS